MIKHYFAKIRFGLYNKQINLLIEMICFCLKRAFEIMSNTNYYNCLSPLK